MIRRPPSPPLFPSTPLFRSRDAADGNLENEARESGVGHHEVRAPADDLHAHPARPRGRERLAQLRLGRALDRKSTRLNSSHGYISYAVFCLKKKKKTNTTSSDAVSEHHPRHRIEPPRAHVHRDETVRPVRCLNSPSPLTLSPRPLPAHTLRA